ncbi:MAG TPA: protein-methionine-sulfoxide reductase heme-binding subunit MsrQ [Paracoccaceae bacterium]
MLAQQVNRVLRRVPPWAVYLAGALPLALLIWDAFGGGLGVDPVKALEQRLGELGLQFLLAGLCVTPLRRATGVNLIRYRRALGLLCFAYISLHLTTWLLLDLQLRWAEIGADLVKRPYIIIGMTGFAAMVPLALTSNNASVRRMGAAAWQKLHRLTYLAAFAGALHYLVLVKAWPIEPILYFAATLMLLALRVAPRRRAPMAKAA